MYWERTHTHSAPVRPQMHARISVLCLSLSPACTCTHAHPHMHILPRKNVDRNTCTTDHSAADIEIAQGQIKEKVEGEHTPEGRDET